MRFFLFVPPVGLEPTRSCEQQILSLSCMPFHHGGVINILPDFPIIAI